MKEPATLEITTKKQSLYWSIRMWLFLKEHPEKDKVNFYIPMYDIDNLWLADCALCEYNLKFKNQSRFDVCSDKKKCPLADKTLCSFNAAGSAFRNWDNANTYYNYIMDKDDKFEARRYIKIMRVNATIIYDALIAEWNKKYKNEEIE